jgi:N-terminal half of MaoC dehydratase
MTRTHVSAQMRAAVGREIRRSVSFPVTDSDIRRWAIAVYYPEPPPRSYWDPGYAVGTANRGIVAPEEFNPFAWMTAAGPAAPGEGGDPNDPDNTERRLGIDGPGLPFQLNGGLEATYGVRIRPGDVVTSVSRLAAYTEREGRLGLMLLTVMEDVWTNQRDEEIKRTRLTLIRY